MDRNDFYNQRDNYKMGGMRKKLVVDLVPEKAGTALDLGCGNGELAEALRNLGWKVIGADVSEKAVEEAGKFLEEGFCFDFEGQSWPEKLMSKKFDLIIASEVIEHVFDSDYFLRKVRSLAAPYGKIIVTTPNVLFWRNRLKIMFGKFEYESKGIMDFGHIRFFTVSTIKSVFKKSGLRIVREKNFYPNLYQRGLNFIGDILPGVFAYQLIFLLSNEKKY